MKAAANAQEERVKLDRVVSSVAASKKYRRVSADTIRRIAECELSNHGDIKETIKATKRRLHQVYGAFEQGTDYDALYHRLEMAYQSGAAEDIEGVCRAALSVHSSSRERVPILVVFYTSIFEFTGRPESLLDIGCGLNPLALPWMNLPSDVQYVALDIDEERARFLNRYLSLVGLMPLARCQDVLVQAPEDEVDVALLLKMSPSLERQSAGATLRVLDRLMAPFVVVSYAIKSLGGREKGMIDQYQRQFSEMAEGRWWEVEKLVFDSELVFIVNRGR
jgi:16S rRNA (guanine(1405)-N(7))-methyltransferase